MNGTQTVIPVSSTPPRADSMSSRLVEMGDHKGPRQNDSVQTVLQNMLEIRGKN